MVKFLVGAGPPINPAAELGKSLFDLRELAPSTLLLCGAQRSNCEKPPQCITTKGEVNA